MKTNKKKKGKTEDESDHDQPKSKPVCSYGSKCYRKNAQHFEEYDHPSDDQEGQVPTKEETEETDNNNQTPVQQSTAHQQLPVCKYGKNCYRTNPEHVAQYSHPL